VRRATALVPSARAAQGCTWSARWSIRLALTLLWSFIVLAFESGGLLVETPSPDALCPPLDQTREVVRARVGSVELEGTWRAIYEIVHRESGDFVALTLVDPAGIERLARELPIHGESCATLAQVISLVLERYFLRPEGVAVAPEEPATLPPAPVPTPNRTPAADVPERSAPASPAESSAEPATLSDAPAGRGGSAVRFVGGLSVTSEWIAPFVGAEAGLGDRFSVVVTAGLDLDDHDEAIAGGWARSLRWPLELTVFGEAWRRGPWSTRFGAGALAMVERASTHGLGEDGAGSRVVPGVSLRGALGVEPGSGRWGTFLEVSGATLLGGLAPEFRVDDRAVLEPRPLAWGMSTGIAMRL